MTKKANYRNLSIEELKGNLENAQHSYQELKFNHGVATVDNTNVIKLNRREIARIMTELHLRRLNELETVGNLSRDKVRARRSRVKKQKLH